MVFYLMFGIFEKLKLSSKLNLCLLEKTCDPRENYFGEYGLTTGKDGGGHRLKGASQCLWLKYNI